MSDTDFFFEETGKQDAVPGMFATGPHTGFIENFRTAYRGTLAAGRTDSREISLREAYDPVVDALNAGFRKAEGFTLVSPDADRMFRNPYRGRTLNPALDAAGGMPPQEIRIWQEITRRRKADPTFLEELGATREEFVARINRKARATLEQEAETRERSTTGGSIGGFIGTMAGGFSDPVNLGSMVIGAGPAKSVLQAALREGAINAGVEIVSTPALAQRRSEIGVPMTLGEAVENVAAAGTLGTIVGGGIELGTRGYARLRDGRAIDSLSESEILAEIDKLGELPPDLAAARAVLAEKVEIEGLNPGPDTPEGKAQHVRNLQDALDRVTDDGLDSAPARRAGLTAEERLNMFSEPAGEGQRQQIAQLTHDIRAARLENEIGPAINEGLATEAGPGATILGGEPSHPAPIVGKSATEQFKSRVRGAESRGDDGARNPESSATGRYQFIDSTWLRYYKRRYGDQGLSDAQILARRGDVQVQERLMDDLIADNMAALRASGHEPTAGALYLSHFLGPGGAKKLLSSARATSVETLLPAEVINANRSVLAGKRVGDVIDWARAKMGDAGPAEPRMVAVGEEVVDGEPLPVVRSLDEVLADSDADDAFIKAIEECLV